MPANTPVTELDRRYSDPGSTAVSWPDALEHLHRSTLARLSTVRGDGRPHVTPVLFVLRDGAAHFATGPEEQKARNLAVNPHCVLTVGGGDFESGFDVMLNGPAERVTGHGLLCSLAEDYVAKYGEDWRFTVREGAFRHPGDGVAEVYRIGTETAYGFGRGIASHTRWRW